MANRRRTTLDRMPDDLHTREARGDVLAAHGAYHKALEALQEAKDALLLSCDHLTALLVLGGIGLDEAISLVADYCNETCKAPAASTVDETSVCDGNGILQFRDEVADDAVSKR